MKPQALSQVERVASLTSKVIQKRPFQTRGPRKVVDAMKKRPIPSVASTLYSKAIGKMSVPDPVPGPCQVAEKVQFSVFDQLFSKNVVVKPREDVAVVDLESNVEVIEGKDQAASTSAIVDLTAEVASNSDGEIEIVQEITFTSETSHLAAIDCLSRATLKSHKVLPRSWVFRQALQSSYGTKFRLCTYNVLCQETIRTTDYLYRHLRFDKSPLDWNNRWSLMAEELKRIDADIFCLQEVQRDHFKSCFEPLMENLDYFTFYKPKTKFSANTHDGCALFVRKSKFSIMNYRAVEYYMRESDLLDKDQIGQVIRLECKATGRQMIVANTHLIFNKNRGDIKLAQLAVLMANVNEELENACLTPSTCPVMFCGDFNIEPTSYVYRFIAESNLLLRGIPRSELSGQGGSGGPTVSPDLLVPPASGISRLSKFLKRDERNRDCGVKDGYLAHPFTLTSVYNHFNNGEKDVSTYHMEAANPDFIFYSVKSVTQQQVVKVFEQPSLRLLRFLSLPNQKQLQATLGPWPNKHMPSDHIPLVADFMLSKK